MSKRINLTNQALEDCIPELRHIWNALVQKDTLPKHVDAIVVGGCRDLGLAERTAELYHSGVSDQIYISGYKPDDSETTEAELLAKRCIELGVPSKAITLEKVASNTGQNILFSAALLNTQIRKVNSIALVHKPFMSLRFIATAEAQWPNPQPRFYTTCQSISFDDYCHKNGLEATAWEMLGDFIRMDEYVSKGFQTPKLLPSIAKDACEKIVSMGFIVR